MYVIFPLLGNEVVSVARTHDARWRWSNVSAKALSCMISEIIDSLVYSSVRELYRHNLQFSSYIKSHKQRETSDVWSAYITSSFQHITKDHKQWKTSEWSEPVMQYLWRLQPVKKYVYAVQSTLIIPLVWNVNMPSRDKAP